MARVEIGPYCASDLPQECANTIQARDAKIENRKSKIENPPLPPGSPVVHLRSASLGTFIYQKMIDRVVGQPDDGDLVAVADKRGRFFGWGFYNSRSQIVLRMLSHETAKPDDAELARRVARAVALRRDVLKLPDVTDAYRLIHAEGDGLCGPGRRPVRTVRRHRAVQPGACSAGWR